MPKISGDEGSIRMDCLEEHHHTPLSSEDSTRILILSPSLRKEAPIQCNLQELSLSKPETKYEAVSYVWGSPQGTMPIVCDGKRLLVTPNCLNALIHLRRRFRARTLWIDAICIDQGRDDVSIRERNLQIPRMGEIYRDSSRVVIWLDLTNINQAKIFNWVRWERLHYNHLVNTARIVGVYPESMSKKTAADLQELSHNPWFFRVWTIQETAFARRAVVQGTHGTAQWKQVSGSLRTWMTSNSWQNVMEPRIAASELCSSKSIHIWTLTTLLRHIPHLQCQVDHDKIFGLYAILNKWLHMPDPDYNKPIQEVFQAVAESCIIGFGSLALLWMTLPSRSTMGLPSWVPDWLPSPAGPSNVDTTGTFGLVFGAQVRIWIAGGHPGDVKRDFGAGIKISGRKLQIPAKRLGKIKSCISYIPLASGDLSDRKQQAKFDNVCRRWCNSVRLNWPENAGEILQTMIRCTSGSTGTEKEWQLFAWYHMVLYPDAKRAARKFEDLSHSDHHLQRLRARYIGKPVSRVLNGLNGLARTHAAFHKEARLGAHYAFIKLDNGLHGRAHYSCLEGDEVHLLPGVSFPMILRRQEDGFRVVAPAYIVGAMKGEFWPEDKSGLETIVLV
ncbi:hypothetical protein PgNI_11074 [Pyricularia grisea]|uniref:Heterokaryon incompatibility domain-containing protein n=1 Tax=Pyricularia grisea TaxID=148305 RepID=A0A6P8AXV3_PYRGI|nr:hypothetical protein PgNI_11074 [Pyricularia grisea]TLD07119.1 hypothetical protein PgNI_11074 [Pyricularia grisea]